jgi:hypothetical protein
MGYITTKKGIKWVRLVVPDDLVSVIRKKNLMESLETKDRHTANQRAPAVIAKLQQQIAEARAKRGGYVYGRGVQRLPQRLCSCLRSSRFAYRPVALLERVKTLEETVKRLQTEAADLKKPPWPERRNA